MVVSSFFLHDLISYVPTLAVPTLARGTSKTLSQPCAGHSRSGKLYLLETLCFRPKRPQRRKVSMEKRSPSTSLVWRHPHRIITFRGHTDKWVENASTTYQELINLLASNELSLAYVQEVVVENNVFPVDIDTVNIMLETCIQYDSPILGLEVFGLLHGTHRLETVPLTIEALVHLTERAYNVHTPVHLSERAYNVLICELAGKGYAKQACMLADRLHKQGFQAAYGTYSALIKSVENEGSSEGTKCGWKYFEHLMEKMKYPVDTPQWICMLNGLCQDDNDLKCVYELTYRHEIRDVHILNAMLAVSVHLENERFGKDIFTRCYKGVNLNAETYEALFKLFLLPNIKQEIAENDNMSCCTYTAIVFHTFLYGEGEQGIPLLEPSIQNSSLIIQGLSAHYPVAAKELFYLMKRSISHDAKTYQILIEALCDHKFPLFAWQLIEDMRADDLEPSNDLYCGMIQSLARYHDPIIACSLFQAWCGQKITPSPKVVYELVAFIENLNMHILIREVYISTIHRSYREWLEEAERERERDACGKKKQLRT